MVCLNHYASNIYQRNKNTGMTVKRKYSIPWFAKRSLHYQYQQLEISSIQCVNPLILFEHKIC